MTYHDFNFTPTFQFKCHDILQMTIITIPCQKTSTKGDSVQCFHFMTCLILLGPELDFTPTSKVYILEAINEYRVITFYYKNIFNK